MSSLAFFATYDLEKCQTIQQALAGQAHLAEMDYLQEAAAILNELLTKDSPTTFCSSWILKRDPRCYTLIRKYIRSEAGGIDWDKVTYALKPKYQRLWAPRLMRKPKPYRNNREISSVLKKYSNKLYVFIAPGGSTHLQTRDTVAVALVRLAQAGNLLAKNKLVKLARDTIDGWSL